MPSPSPTKVRDQFIGFPGGVNSGLAPSLLPKDQLSAAVNATVRGGYVSPRPIFRKIELDFQDSEILEERFTAGRFQGADFYLSDSGEGAIIAAISGRLFRVTVGDPNVVVQEVTITFNTTTTFVFVAPAVNSTAAVVVTSTANMSAGAYIIIGSANYQIISINGSTGLTVKNLDDTPGTVHAVNTVLQYFDLNPASRPMTWMQQAEKWLVVQDGQSVPIIFDGASARRSNVVSEISAGKMMAYWLGRLWWVNPDGQTFRAGDLVYSNGQRSAVLNQTQNSFLGNGGNFTVPSNGGQITAMRPVNVLDNSLGQGPLQVSTPNMIFGCTASTDSTVWQTTNDPILGVSQIESGSLSHWSTVLANGDMFYRSVNGIQSLVLGRREFNVWGNVPQSQEMNAILDSDNQSLLQFSSAIVFDNRLLMTAGPIPSQRGVYHRGIVAMDFDVISSLRQKLPPVYDGVWTGLRVMKLIKGTFGNLVRAFAFSMTTGGTLELYELLPSGEGTMDNDTTAITWSIETADAFKESGIGEGKEVRLTGGEMYIDNLVGFASFQVFFRPDQSSCWIPWNNFSVCAKTCEQAVDPYECLTEPFAPPQYRKRLGFGEPPGTCNPDTDSPYREGNTFGIRVVVTGSVRIKSIQLRGAVIDEPEEPPAMCQSDCYTPTVYSSAPQQVCCQEQFSTLVNSGGNLPSGISLGTGCLILAAGARTSTVSQPEADAAALEYLQSVYDALIGAGTLECAISNWSYAGTYIDENGDSQPGQENTPPVFEADQATASISPVLPAFDTTCNGQSANGYACDLGLANQFGPFAEDKFVTIRGTYNVQGFAWNCDPATSIALHVEASGLGVDGTQATWDLSWSRSDDFTDSGSWHLSGNLRAGSTCNINLTASVAAFGDPALTQPPVVEFLMTSVETN